MTTPRITERHRVIAGVIWLDHAPIATVETVRNASDPDGVWITLRPGRDYRVVDAEGGQLYVAALVGTLVEVTYTITQATAGAVNADGGAHQRPHGRYGRGIDQYPGVSAERAP